MSDDDGASIGPAGAARDASGADRDTPVGSLLYDDAFAQLQGLVAELEAGGQPLETTIRLYERAVALQRHCERLLAEAELRVRQLMSQPGGEQVAVDVVADDARDEPDEGPAS